MTPLSASAIAGLAQAFCIPAAGPNLGPEKGNVFQKFLSIIQESPLLVSEIESFIKDGNVFHITGNGTPPKVPDTEDAFDYAAHEIYISFVNNPPPTNTNATQIADTYAAVDGNNGANGAPIVAANYYGGAGDANQQVYAGLSQIIGTLSHELGHYEDAQVNHNPALVGSTTAATHVAYGLLSEGVAENNNLLVAEQIAENSFKDTGTPIDINVSIDGAASVASNINLVKYYESKEVISPTSITVYPFCSLNSRLHGS